MRAGVTNHAGAAAGAGAAGPSVFGGNPYAVVMPSPARTVLLAVAACAIASTPALGAAEFTVKEGPTPGVTAGGAFTWFTGMYSAAGNPRGHVMGSDAGAAGSTLMLAFGAGARLVARNALPKVASGPAVFRRQVVGGTGPYLGARGMVLSRKVGGIYTHAVTYTLPPRGTRRATMSYVVRLRPAQTTQNGGARGVGNRRVIAGTVFDAGGTQVGTYAVDSTLAYVYGAGTYEWFVGAFGYVFADGTLMARGPYQRAAASAPGALTPSGRVVTGGTGAYAGMRGQVVVTPNSDGTSTHSFTLVRR